MPKTSTVVKKPRPAVRGVPFEIVTGRQARLYVPHRSRHVPASAWIDYNRPVPQEWKAIAHSKGFRIRRRIRDRLHVALECHCCGSLTAQRVFTLRMAQPRCGGCAETAMIAEAQAAGLIFLRRDKVDHHYALYRAGCGHVVRRQLEFVSRMAAGKTDLCCDRCLIAREQAEARRQGWERLRRDRNGNPNYRIYQHSCGQIQRAARVNLAWGQCKCQSCGGAWNAHPSFIYLVRIEVPGLGLHLLKMGFSKHPQKRFRHQLGLPRTARVDLVRTIPITSGHDACALEKAAHAQLRHLMPEVVVPAEVYAGVVNTKSEIYTPAAFAEIMRLMDVIEAAHPMSSASLQPAMPVRTRKKPLRTG
ncbi:MAG: hypothetical protein KJ731_20485 [Alphaproteobacteria bacterium]|nr:hypothetical protein [Alphaproteobacteria bacterium]MBU1278377.1 hypothetical protein [Alphaproteobacteria bacterium]MBU1830829.1 hypothetical protein [Alphaproteobacteria bacterium]MBU2076493.1 hypothetical protein [Alphaproteobacteria bacterium]MBU2160596.1 hypothetical protein [Alphaproteobacteria bacterium]